MDSGLGSLLIVAGLHGIAADEAILRHEFGDEAFSVDKLLLAARSLGMKAQLVAQPAERLDRVPLPAIALDCDGGFFIFAKYDQGGNCPSGAAARLGPRVLVQRPGDPPAVLDLADFLVRWSGQFIFLTSRATFTEELASCDPAWNNILDLTDDLGDFSDTAALIDNLDLVIGVDTAVIHLAAALGKPTWLLNRFNTCWRWLLNRDDSPWYPTMRVFRQPTLGDWESVIQTVAHHLQQFAQRREGPSNA